MTSPVQCPACLVCGDSTLTVANYLPAGMILHWSGCAVAEFLVKFNVLEPFDVKGDSDPCGKLLCANCFTVVINCDQWHHSFENGIEGLKRKAATNTYGGSTNEETTKPKFESSDQPVNLVDPLMNEQPMGFSSEVFDEFHEIPVESILNSSVSDEVENGGTESLSSSPRTRVPRPNRDNKSNREKRAKMCPYCFIPTANINYADHFVESHSNQKFKRPIYIEPFKCPACPYETRVKDTYERHLYTHGLGDVQKVLRYKCPDCDARFVNPYSIEPHRHREHGAEKAYECKICGLKFCNKLSVKVHTKEKHSDSPPQRVCEHCGESVMATRYTDHLKSKHCVGPKKIYQCTHCPISYKTPFALRLHMHTVHKVGPYVKRKFEATCAECGKRFISKDFFLAHMFKLHGQELPGLKKIVCPHCPEIFHVKTTFQTHMMGQHTGEKLTCPDCGYETTFSGNMSKHRNNVHGKRAKQ